MDIDGLGGETVDLLRKEGLIQNYADLYNLKIEQIIPLERMAEKSAENMIVGIEKSDVHEYKFSVRSGDYKINFGKLSEMETKFKKLKAFYSKTFKDKTIKNYNLINLKYHNQVVCIK